jgi:hypothetical protein
MAESFEKPQFPAVFLVTAPLTIPRIAGIAAFF